MEVGVAAPIEVSETFGAERGHPVRIVAIETERHLEEAQEVGAPVYSAHRHAGRIARHGCLAPYSAACGSRG